MNVSIVQLIWETRMKKFVVHLLLFGIIVATNATAQNFWQQTNGPGAGNFRAFAFNPATRDIFAGSSGDGVLRSTDNGANWVLINTGLPSTEIIALAVNANGHLFVSTLFRGVFRSTNNGDSWAAANTGLAGYVNAFAVNTSGHIFAGTAENGVYRSTDSGGNWTPVNNGLTDLNTEDFAINASGNIFVATLGGGVFRSLDNGDSWTPVNNGLTDLLVYSLAVNPATRDIFAGTSDRGIFRSTDNGGSWTAVNTGLTTTRVLTLAINAGGQIFAGSPFDGVFRSTNNGGSWTQVNTGLLSFLVRYLAVNSVTQDIFVGTDGSGLFRSTNNGNSWTFVNTGLTNTDVLSLAINPATQEIFAGTDRNGVFRSADNGRTWTLAVANLQVWGLAINSSGHLFAATTIGMFRSTDNGGNWTLVFNEYFLSIVINASGNIFGGTKRNGVYLSTNNGNSWVRVNNGLTTTADIEALAINSSGHLFAGTSGGVFRSLDNGASWSAVNTGLTTSVIHALAINARGNIFAGTDGGGVFRSTDNGGSWTAINNGLTDKVVRALAINASGYIFAGTFNGVFCSTDNGSSWVNTGLVNLDARSFAIDTSGYIFAGTYSIANSSGTGVFRSVAPTLPAPRLSLSSNSVNFGAVAVGNNADLTVTVTNTSNAALPVNSAVLAGTNAADFSIVSGGGATTLPPLGSAAIALRFSPQSAGSKTASLIITSHAASSPDTVSLSGTATVAQGIAQDSLTLVDFYNSTNGPNWTNNTNWLSAQPVSTWFGVRVGANRVTELNLGNNNLVGTLPTTIGNLTNLTFLELGFNKLTGTIPAAIGNLTQLTQLGLVSNQLSGAIPAEIGGLVNLNFLYLYTNQLTGSIPKEIGSLANLTNLDLHGNQLSGAIPAEIGNLTKLTDLYLDGNQLTGSIPTTIGNLANLTYLESGNNKLTGAIPAAIGNLTKLTNLGLVSNQLSGAIPAEIGGLVNLRFLYLYTNQLTGFIPTEIGNLTNLTNLDLHSNQLSGAIPTAIGNLTKLTDLQLFNNRFVDLPNLAPITTLRELQIQSNRFTFEDIEPNIRVATFNYSPQDSVGATQNVRSAVGSSLTLTVTVGGANNKYQWLKNRAAISGATNSSYLVNQVRTADAGAYTCEITNTVATALTLVRRPVNIDVLQIQTPVTPITASVGQGLTINVAPPQNFQPTLRQLFYRQAGRRSYQTITLTPAPAGSNFTGVIPSDSVTVRGLEYYVSLSDGQIVVTFPAADPVNKPAFIPVQIGRVNYPFVLQKETYRMISVPLLLRDTQFDSVLADDFGEYNSIPRQWRLFRWQNEDNAEHPGLDSTFTPGNAFWLITREDSLFDVENAQSVNSSQSFSLLLQPGWNQIATPFAFPVAWDSVRVIGGALQQRPVRWNGKDYEYNQTTLERWEGYFVFNGNPAAVSLSVPPRESRGAPPEMIGKISGLAANEFLLQIKAHGLKSGWKDEQNFVGMLANATNESDRFDFLEAPPIGDHLRLSIVENHVYAGNFHAVSATGSFWDLRLSTTGKKENVRLIFSEQKKLPEGFQILVLDTDRQSSLPMAQGQTELEISARGATKNLRVIVGTAEFAGEVNAGIPLIPHQFALRQNYPNPFLSEAKSRSAGNPETKIEYELAERAEVKLEIFNLLGQRVRVLINATQAAGAYTINWDGKDHRGNFANSGVYFYRLKAGDPSTGSGQGYVAVRKLVLSR